MDNPAEVKLATETKPEASTHATVPMNEFETARIASKQRKKRSHQRKLRRSNSKG